MISIHYIYQAATIYLSLILVFSGDAKAQDQVSLFDGKTLNGWRGNPDIWHVKNGAITASIKPGQRLKKNEFIYWKDTVSNFDLTLEYRITGNPTANSGIQFRSQRDKNGHATGYQADLDDGKKWLGRIYDEHGRALITERGTLTKVAPDGKRHVIPFATPKSLEKHAKKNDWNTYRIICRGHRMEIYINDIHFSTLEDYQTGKYDLEGLLALQIHSGIGPVKLQFKNIRIKKFTLSVPEAGETEDTSGEARNIEDSPFNKSPLLWSLKKNANQKDRVSTVREMLIPEGFEVSTIAAEPMIKQPIAFDFDAKGRIWVVEAMDYPIRREGGKGRDRILILEDKDGDGDFESKKIFAENLDLVSGIAIGYGGVFVGAAPELYFIPDKDGDDIPDGAREILLDGWSIRDTHETLNSFMWGNDGWLYGCQGVFNPSYVGKPGTPKDQRTYIEAAVWRFHPVSHKFEIYSQGGSNQWGLTYNQHGDMFMTHCRSSWGLGPVTQLFRDGHYWQQANRNHKPFIAAPLGRGRRREIAEINFMESIAAYGHGEGGAGEQGSKAIFGGHSHVGAMVYLGDNWPEEYRGNLYTLNLHGSQMNRESLVKKDSAYLSYSHGRDHLYSPDSEYLGVHLKYGPDGAVYISDWADKQQCHNKKESIWNRNTGRIYRMAWKESYQPVKIDLISQTSMELIAYLPHTNQWYAHMAQHLLRQRRVAGENLQEVTAKLRDTILNPDSKHRLNYLTALEAVGGITEEIYRQLINDEDQHIAKLSLTYLTEKPVAGTKVFGSQLVDLAKTTPYPTLRLHLAGICQSRISEPYARQILDILALKKEDANDRFIPKMIWYGYSKYVVDEREIALSLALKTPLPSLRRSIFWRLAKLDLNAAMSSAMQLPNNHKLTEALGVFSQTIKNKKNAITAAPANWAILQKKANTLTDVATQKYITELNTKFGLQKADADALKLEHQKARQQAFMLCAACHAANKDQPGPALEEIAQIYDNKADIINWIVKPGKKRQAYPQMPAFPNLSKRDLELIAEHLLFLKK